MIKIMIAVAILGSNTARADTQQGTSPPVGIVTTATIGGVMLEEYRFRGVPGVVLKGQIEANWGTLEKVDIPTGTALVIIR